MDDVEFQKGKFNGEQTKGFYLFDIIHSTFGRSPVGFNNMAKRFTDSRKWDDPWFLELSLEHKMIWIHILDKCNHAGIYKVNIKMINFCLNIKLTKNDLEKAFIGRFYKINNHKWFIPKFIEFQYGALSEKNRVHNSVIEILRKEGLYKVYKRGILTPKDKNKDIDKDKELIKEKDKDTKRNVIFFLEYFNSKNNVKLKQTDDRKELVKKKLKEGYTLEQLKTCVDNFIQDDWEDRSKYIDVIYCIGKQRGKPDNLEKWLNWVKPNPLNLLKPGDLHDKSVKKKEGKTTL